MYRARESNTDVYKALLEYRVTPTESTNIAPATLFFNRNLRGILPATAKALQPADTNKLQQARENLIADRCRQAHYYNRKAKPRPELLIGDTVRFRATPSSQETRVGRIAEKLPYRSYNIQLPDHSLRRRTSRHIRFAPEVSVHEFDRNEECGPLVFLRRPQPPPD